MIPRPARPLLLLATIPALCATCPVRAELIPDPPPGIQYTIETDRDVYQLGENVLVSQKVVNPSQWDFTLRLNMTPGFDLWALRDGVKIWSTHIAFFLYGSAKTVGPGEMLQRDYVWDMRDYNGDIVPPGEYEMRSVIYGNGRDVSKTITIVPEPATFRIMLLTWGLLPGKRRSARGPRGQ